MHEHERSDLAVRAEPYESEFDPALTALPIIDMQRDFVDPGGFGEQLAPQPRRTPT